MGAAGPGFLQSHHFSYQIVRLLTRFFILKKELPWGTFLKETRETNLPRERQK